MLEKLELHNFKSHRSTQLHFDDSRLHAIVGQNSSGKTSILQALYSFSLLANAQFKDVFQYQRKPDFIVATGQNNISVIAIGSSNNSSWNYCYQFNKLDEKWMPFLNLKIDGVEYDNGWDTNRWDSSLKGEEYKISSDIEFAVYLKLSSTNLAKESYSEAIIPKIELDGSGLAPTLDYLRSEAPEKFQSLQEMLQKIVPSVRKIGTKRAKVQVDRQRLIEVDGKSISYGETQEVIGQEIVLDMNTGDRIPAHAISEGTMLTLGLLTVLMNPNQPNLVLLDDIEQGLHPKAQRELISVFKEIIQANPNLQIIFSTHSPYIIDELAPSQVHVLSNSKSGFTSTKRLDEHPDIEWAKQTLTTGEFWDAEGEDWVDAGEKND